jgi:hypothetical protein
LQSSFSGAERDLFDEDAVSPSLSDHHHALLSHPAQFQIIRAHDLRSIGYIEKHDPPGQPELWADGRENSGEKEHRHPGDRPEDDSPASEVYNKAFQALTTKAMVHGLAFACPQGPSEGEGNKPPLMHAEMHAAYKMQFLVRVDPHRNRIIYDCFEAVPRFIDVGTSHLPTRRGMLLFKDIIGMGEDRGPCHDCEGDEFDTFLDRPFKNGFGMNEATKTASHMRDLTAQFLTGRQFRCAFSFDHINGIRLHRPIKDTLCALVLELGTPLPLGTAKEDPCTFAVRRVFSAQQADNRFKRTDDWTPGSCASRASRHYLYGDFDELKELSAYLCRVSPRLASLFSPTTVEEVRGNTLLEVPSSVLCYDAAPPFSKNSLEELIPMNSAENTPKAMVVGKDVSLNGRGQQQQNCRDRRTVQDIHEQLLMLGVGVEAFSGGNCVKRAMFLWLVKLPTSEQELQEVFWSGTCEECHAVVKCTLLDALKQDDSGGYDYEDGNEKGAIHCENCGRCSYLSRICSGKPESTSGKFHNHCHECPDFGECIAKESLPLEWATMLGGAGDYCMSHCSACGEHWFAGSMGNFPCTECGSDVYGNRKGKAPTDEAPPTGWSGYIGIDDLFETVQQQMVENMAQLFAADGIPDGLEAEAEMGPEDFAQFQAIAAGGAFDGASILQSDVIFPNTFPTSMPRPSRPSDGRPHPFSGAPIFDIPNPGAAVASGVEVEELSYAENVNQPCDAVDVTDLLDGIEGMSIFSSLVPISPGRAFGDTSSGCFNASGINSANGNFAVGSPPCAKERSSGGRDPTGKNKKKKRGRRHEKVRS